MPRVAGNDPRNLIGKRVRVPAGLKAVCQGLYGQGGCDLMLKTDGTDVAVAQRQQLWNGRFLNQMGFMAFLLTCPNCGRDDVQFVTEVWVG